jgi:DNA invertase Pin-like site-specific DNA recombinase
MRYLITLRGMKTKAIGYVRVSTEDQAAEGYSLEAQRAKLDRLSRSRADVLALVDRCGRRGGAFTPSPRGSTRRPRWGASS